MTWIMFIFCVVRVATHILRIAWATRPENARLTIAAQVFTSIGVLIIYLVVFMLAQRILRATHPKWGWNKVLSKTCTVAYVLLAVALLTTIAFTIVSFYTLDTKVRSVALWIQRVSILYMLIFNVVAVALLLLSALLPRAPNSENFGTGSLESKMIILGQAMFFSLFIAGFRMGVSWSAPRPASRPAWFDSKAAFYVIEFGFEIIVVYLFLFTRFDRRYWVPNGSSKPGDYSRVDMKGVPALGMAELDESAHGLGSKEDRASLHGNA